MDRLEREHPRPHLQPESSNVDVGGPFAASTAWSSLASSAAASYVAAAASSGAAAASSGAAAEWSAAAAACSAAATRSCRSRRRGGGRRPSGGGTSSADRARPAGADLAVDRQAPARGRPAGGGRLAGGRAPGGGGLGALLGLAGPQPLGVGPRRRRRRDPRGAVGGGCRPHRGGRRVATGRRQDHSHQRAEQQADGGADELWTAAQASPRSGRSRACRRTRGCTCRCGPGPSSDGPSTACTCRAGRSA